MMMSVSKSLGRTVHYNNFTFYSTDGFGRDGYISYNNGGYWKDNLKGVISKPKYPLHTKPVLMPFGKLPPPVRYHSDGTGRDSYVVDRAGGLVKSFSPLNQIPLASYLRSPEFTPRTKQKAFCTQREFQTNALLNKIQREVVSRLFHKGSKEVKNRFVLSKGRRKVEMLDNLNSDDPVLRKSQSTRAMNHTRAVFLPNYPTVIVSPSSTAVAFNEKKKDKMKYTTILRNKSQNQLNSIENHSVNVYNTAK